MTAFFWNRRSLQKRKISSILINIIVIFITIFLFPPKDYVIISIVVLSITLLIFQMSLLFTTRKNSLLVSFTVFSLLLLKVLLILDYVNLIIVLSLVITISFFLREK
ncbi:hypothetical protein A3C23_05255 [Candidatus Roizmanbacteria bacterium RIFCSPHIGHO2_02_FULL_37_13b]|uniref:Uncharacterized protein n=1 Tax=Candidatus Roizmanbacteria bacterium RIFCSPLOWO2_02_FULL_36_11 TaxID=1802071 RepID=A0A1F7JCL1_9BACT|nr:MAG: hypothetical protein A3C23_05255 [Candidatus Roizmanbacteria bacterium RIFCSPHIGHO2_02_FULL_37_13b]OGK53348.1 MAG: hypothetical protein A3H78_03535 [Candidatus Roizmanbacteria bacterium RIFCSPLOWO2_02_FULL_36_11]